MASASVLARLHIEFKHFSDGISRCVALLEDGAPPPYIARYRRVDTGGLDEQTILGIAMRLEQLVEIERRRATILRSLEQLDRCTPALRARLETTFDRAKLEDLYRPHRPKKKTRCAQALAAGLAPLAEAIATGAVAEGSLQSQALSFVKPEAGFENAAQVLDGVSHILGEWVADDPYVRQHVRDTLRKRGCLRVHPIEGAKGAERHRSVAQIDESLLRIAPHRYLLVRRGEREKALRAEIAMDPEEILSWIEARYLDGVRVTNSRRRGSRKKGSGDAALQASGEHAEEHADDHAEEHGEEHVEAVHATEAQDDGAHDKNKPDEVISEGRFEGLSESPYESELPHESGDKDDAQDDGDAHQEAERDHAELEAASAAEAAEASTSDEGAEEHASGAEEEAEEPPSLANEDHTGAIPAPPHPAAPAQPLTGEVRELMRLAIRSAFTRWILGSCEEDVRLDTKQRCELEILRGYQRNLRGLLLAPCAGRVSVMGFDPAPRGAWRYAIADARGAFVAEGAVQAGDEEAAVATRIALFAALEQHQVRMIAVGNGENSKKIARALRTWLAEKGSRVQVALTIEAGAGEYAASARGRIEHAQLDPAVRAALGMARRAQDPLAEIAKADWRHLGLGPLQSEVGKGRLQRALEEVMRSIVAQVGIDLSIAPAALLQYAPGLDADQARAIVAERDQRGGFRKRRDALEVAGVDATKFEYAEGFLRLDESEDPLDRTHLIEEHRAIAEAFAAVAGKPLSEIVGQRGALHDVDFDQVASRVAEAMGGDGPELRGLLDGVRRELENVARDMRARRRWPRAEFIPVAGAALEAGQEVEGVCSNVTSFGLFLDLGLEQDALVHISEMGSRFVRHPQDVAHVGDVVRARVLKVDGERGRIALTLRPAPREARRRAGPGGPGRPEGAGAGGGHGAGHGDGAPGGGRPSDRREGGGRPERPGDRPRGREREPEGNVRAAQSRRDGLGGGRGGNARGRGGPGGGGGGGGGFSRGGGGGPRGAGGRGPGRGDDDRRGGDREDYGQAAPKAPRGRELGWNPFRSFFGKNEEGSEAEPQQKNEAALQPKAKPAQTEPKSNPAVADPKPPQQDGGGVPPLTVEDASE